MTKQKNAYIDVNPVIVNSDQKIVLAKRTQGIVGEENGTCLEDEYNTRKR